MATEGKGKATTATEVLQQPSDAWYFSWYYERLPEEPLVRFYLCDEITPLKRLIEYMYKYKRKMRKIGIIVAVQFAVFKLAI